MGSAELEMCRDKVKIFITGIQPQPMSALFKSGVTDLIGIENLCGDIDEVLKRSGHLAKPSHRRT